MTIDDWIRVTKAMGHDFVNAHLSFCSVLILKSSKVSALAKCMEELC